MLHCSPHPSPCVFWSQSPPQPPPGHFHLPQGHHHLGPWFQHRLHRKSQVRRDVVQGEADSHRAVADQHRAEQGGAEVQGEGRGELSAGEVCSIQAWENVEMGLYSVEFLGVVFLSLNMFEVNMCEILFLGEILQWNQERKTWFGDDFHGTLWTKLMVDGDLFVV